MGEIVVAPHTDGPPQHRHAQHDEGFYVVAGTVRFTRGETSYDAPTGTLVMVPPGAPHTFANPGDEPAVMLNTFTPDLYVQYFRDIRDLIACRPAAVGRSRGGRHGAIRHRARHGLRALTEPAATSALPRKRHGTSRTDEPHGRAARTSRTDEPHGRAARTSRTDEPATDEPATD